MSIVHKDWLIVNDYNLITYFCSFIIRLFRSVRSHLIVYWGGDRSVYFSEIVLLHSDYNWFECCYAVRNFKVHGCGHGELLNRLSLNVIFCNFSRTLHCFYILTYVTFENHVLVYVIIARKPDGGSGPGPPALWWTVLTCPLLYLEIKCKFGMWALFVHVGTPQVNTANRNC